MATTIKISALPAASGIDGTADVLPIVQSGITNKISRSTFLGVSGQPVDISTLQTLTNKTLTAPTISGPTLSGTVIGTYTLGGTPTFPSSVVTLTGSQTLTNKILTAPTITSPSITGTVGGAATYSTPTLTVPVIADFSSANHTHASVPTGGTITTNPGVDGWVTGLATPNTVTYNGNRNYSLVFNGTDLTSKLSNGMRLKLTRTAAAPTQCTSLNGTTQFFNKSSLSGMTFTTTFTCMGWVKLASYNGAINTIISRNNGTNGWLFFIDASGRLEIQIGSGGRTLVSSQSIPLNKWIHVAGSIDLGAGTGALYFDGQLVTSTIAGASASLTQAGNLELGSDNGGLIPFNGKLAQVAVFSAVIAQATIQSYISQTLAGSETSLVSAYSFNGSIKDLNTSNANDLTAQNGALATNADSPFAGGANASTAFTAGTTEFGEVFNVVFSTNTTAIIQAPDGYAIPTTGGVSAVSYSTQASPLGWISGTHRLANPLLIGPQTVNGPATTTAIPGLTASVYIPSGRKVRVKFYCNNASSTGAAPAVNICLSSASDANRISQWALTSANGGAPEIEYIPSVAGTVVFVAGVIASSGNVTFNTATVAPSWLSVEVID